ncbi:MAG TPA: tetratricopeptide repeat protein [Candidatus Xenobia bacterium]|nr:tetratricopeptide repeat protein [Candidatus Xenobia bacterium]
MSNSSLLRAGVIVGLFCVSAIALGAQEPEATSLLGKPLYAPAISAESRPKLEENLARARAEYEKNPDDADAIIWLGRRTAYLGRYRDAIAIFSEGIAKHPNDARMYRHRGHRYLTVRELDNAIADLKKAAELVAGKPDEVEPDGQPNPKNIPRSTLQSNIWYHLGLTYYLKGDFAHAREAFDNCLMLSDNDDMVVASSYWLYLSWRRLGERNEALFVLQPISEKMNILENSAYHRLLLFFKGARTADAVLASAESDLDRATLGYGVGAYYLVNGQPDKARTLFEQIVAGPLWPAFGHLAAEAELARQ